jgi:hypothetical protein
VSVGKEEGGIAMTVAQSRARQRGVFGGSDLAQRSSSQQDISRG